METMTRRSLVETMGLSLVIGGIAAGLVRSAPPATYLRPDASTARALLQQRHLPNVPLVTHQGEPVHFYDDLVKDKKIIINFFDHGLAESEVVTRNLVTAHRLLGSRMGRDIHLYSVTLNPERDTPAVLRTFARQHGDQTGWIHLTGEPAHIETLRQAIGFAYPDRADDTNRSSITSILRYGNEPEMRWAYAATLGNPDMIVHMILGDFGPDPTDPTAQFNWYCKLPSL